MCTNVRPNVSTKNPYYITKHRYYELRHFCMQYKDWKICYRMLDKLGDGIASVKIFDPVQTSRKGEAKFVDSSIKKLDYLRNIELVESCAKEADEALQSYIMKAVTEGVSFVKLKTIYEIPCEKDMFYDRFRKFFWLLHHKKGI